MKFKDLLKGCKVTVKCGKCGEYFSGEEKVCPGCRYDWQNEFRLSSFKDLRKDD